jgi:hypothetical protein
LFGETKFNNLLYPDKSEFLRVYYTLFSEIVWQLMDSMVIPVIKKAVASRSGGYQNDGTGFKMA